MGVFYLKHYLSIFLNSLILFKENQLELEMQQLLQEAQDAAEEAGTGQPTTEEAVNVRSTAASEETIPDNTNIADESSKNEKSQILDASNKTGVKELAENRNLEDNKQNSGLVFFFI